MGSALTCGGCIRRALLLSGLSFPSVNEEASLEVLQSPSELEHS